MAVNRMNVVVGAIGAVAVVGFAWWLLTAIKETKERALEGKRQQEQAQQAQQEAERAAALAEQKKRAVVVARLASGPVPTWTAEEASLRLAVVQGEEGIRSNSDLCPKYKKLWERMLNTTDEFEHRKLKSGEMELIQNCLEVLKTSSVRHRT